VISVNYSNSPVTLETNSGAQLIADYVLVTVPLTTLKRHSIKFTPQLPDVKMTAINSLGVGVLEKVRYWFDQLISCVVLELYACNVSVTKLTFRNVSTPCDSETLYRNMRHVSCKTSSTTGLRATSNTALISTAFQGHFSNQEK